MKDSWKWRHFTLALSSVAIKRYAARKPWPWPWMCVHSSMTIQKYSKRIFVLNVRFICVQKMCCFVTTNMENEYSKIFKKDFCTQRENNLRTKNVFLCHDKYANLVTLYQVTIHFEWFQICYLVTFWLDQLEDSSLSIHTFLISATICHAANLSRWVPSHQPSRPRALRPATVRNACAYAGFRRAYARQNLAFGSVTRARLYRMCRNL